MFSYLDCCCFLKKTVASAPSKSVYVHGWIVCGFVFQGDGSNHFDEEKQNSNEQEMENRTKDIYTWVHDCIEECVIIVIGQNRWYM